jgi:hypothetical protein
MVQRGRPKNHNHVKRFSISLETEDYQKLRTLADHQKPRLSLQYLVQYAVQRLLENPKGYKLTVGRKKATNKDTHEKG